MCDIQTKSPILLNEMLTCLLSGELCHESGPDYRGRSDGSHILEHLQAKQCSLV